MTCQLFILSLTVSNLMNCILSFFFLYFSVLDFSICFFFKFAMSFFNHFLFSHKFSSLVCISLTIVSAIVLLLISDHSDNSSSYEFVSVGCFFC